jgi:DNA-binding GntR family transcriptional regulator
MAALLARDPVAAAAVARRHFDNGLKAATPAASPAT